MTPAIADTMRVLVSANEKGGVGKTTLAFHAVHKLSEKRRVLVIDLDQQQSALAEPMRAYASPIDAISMFAEPTVIPSIGPITLAARTRSLRRWSARTRRRWPRHSVRPCAFAPSTTTPS